MQVDIRTQLYTMLIMHPNAYISDRRVTSNTYNGGSIYIYTGSTAGDVEVDSLPDHLTREGLFKIVSEELQPNQIPILIKGLNEGDILSVHIMSSRYRLPPFAQTP